MAERKTIPVDPEVHQRLKSMKREGETFSELLDRLTEPDSSASAGFWADTEVADNARAARERMRESFGADTDER